MRENPIKMDDLGVPRFLESSTWFPQENDLRIHSRRVDTYHISMGMGQNLSPRRDHKSFRRFLIFTIQFFGYPMPTHTIQFWLVLEPPLRKILVNWDDEIPNIWENQMFQTTNQSFILFVGFV